MSKRTALTLILTAFCFASSFSQSMDSLRMDISTILSTKNATVGVSIMGMNGKDTLTINGNKHVPMQSVFKFHIALAVLDQVDKGRLKLDQYIPISKEDVQPDYYSPIRDSFPDGTSMTLSKLLEYTVAMSDNIGCDVLLKLIGGPAEVEKYLHKNGIADIAIKHNEATMQSNWSNQYDNWTTANCANQLLWKYYKNKKKILSKKSYTFLWYLMKATSTGPMRLKGELPENVIVAHKTGTSGENEVGKIAAVNDIGIVFLPNGNYYFISIFVSDSMHSYEENEKIIADISKAVYDCFVRM